MSRREEASALPLVLAAIVIACLIAATCGRETTQPIEPTGEMGGAQ